MGGLALVYQCRLTYAHCHFLILIISYEAIYSPNHNPSFNLNKPLTNFVAKQKQKQMRKQKGNIVKKGGVERKEK